MITIIISYLLGIQLAFKKGKKIKGLDMKKFLVLLSTLMILMTTSIAYADTFSFIPANTFSGTPPAGSLNAAFSDVSGGVQLLITSTLASGENLDPGKALYLNFNPVKDLSLLAFSLIANTSFSQESEVETGVDAYKADGDGSYDIRFTYDPGTKAFTNGQSQTYLITGTGILASDFNFLSKDEGGSGPFYAAVHVQNTPTGGVGSGWVSPSVTTGVPPVPEPIALLLLGTGFLFLGGIGRRFKKA